MKERDLSVAELRKDNLWWDIVEQIQRRSQREILKKCKKKYRGTGNLTTNTVVSLVKITNPDVIEDHPDFQEIVNDTAGRIFEVWDMMSVLETVQCDLSEEE